MQVRYRAPPFNLNISRIFLHVGLCSHTFSVVGEVAASHASDHRSASLIAWTRVHAITNLNTCAKSGISGDDQWAYLMTRGGARSLRSSSRFRDFAIGEHREDTLDHPISVGRATQMRYLEALEALDLHLDFDRDWIMIAIQIGRLTF